MISELFNEELQLVDATKVLTYVVDETYGRNEWSVAGWTVTGGSEYACEHGACAALYQLGFRWWTPAKTTRPESVPAGGVTIAKTEHVMPYVRIYNNYGFGSNTYQVHKDFDRWAILNCVNDKRQRIGHTWPALINAIDAEDEFFTENPTYMTGTVGHAANSFNLDLTGADREALINRVAQEIVENRINDDLRVSFDPPDGDTWPTDAVMTFTSEVCAKVRESVPGVLLGVYAYAGHREPPTEEHPHTYVQVATGFSSLGLGYPALVDLWAKKVHDVAIRGYGMIAAHREWHPFEGHVCKKASLNDFESFIASGVRGLNLETTSNFLPALVGHYRITRYVKDGTTTYDEVLAEIVDKLYGGDQAVKALYDYWSDLSTRYNFVTLKKSCELIDAISEENRGEFERYMAWLLLYHKATNDMELFTDEYWVVLERLLRWARGMGPEHTVHDYAFQRRYANSWVIRNGRPDLAFNKKTDWKFNPSVPTHEDYIAMRDENANSFFRPEELEDPRLVLVDTGEEPTNATSLSALTRNTSCKFMGPGSVTTNEGTVTYGEGLHDMLLTGTVSWEGGVMFINDFPEIRMDRGEGTGDNDKYLYVPHLVAGRVHLAGGANLRIIDRNGDVLNLSHWETKADLTPGIVRIDHRRTRGNHKNINCNPWISSNAALMLMPRALAEAEFPEQYQPEPEPVPEPTFETLADIVAELPGRIDTQGPVGKAALRIMEALVALEGDG